MVKKSKKLPRGIAIDSDEDRAFDPSENVKALNIASDVRQDDLRLANEKLFEVHIQHVKEIGEIRAAHATEIRQMETERLDSIRQVDVLARNTAADRAADAIQALAATTATNAENLRTALANTAATIAKQTADNQATTAKQVSDAFEAVTKRVASLEASAYRGEGREKFSDPQIEKVLATVTDLQMAARQNIGKSEGIDKTWGIILIIVTLIISVSGVIITLMLKH
jgi:hypothetical protein